MPMSTLTVTFFACSYIILRRTSPKAVVVHIKWTDEMSED